MNKKSRVVLIFSDIEMSTGDQYDDFPHTAQFAELLVELGERYPDQEVDLVFNGDTFDFLKMEVAGTFPHLIDIEIAQHKFSTLLKVHRPFFQGLERFLDGGPKPRRVHFIVGNHDMELLFPEVQNDIIAACGGSGQIFFPGFELKIGDLHIEHGNQVDPAFVIDPENPFIQHKGKRILNLPWATVTLLNTILPHRPDFYQLDRIKPRHWVFEEIPNLKEFVMSTLWRYWTNDFFSANDPLKKVSWSMVKQAFKRSLVFHSDVEIEDKLYKRLVSTSNVRTYVMGHMHEPRITSYGNRRLIQSGCFRDEFMLDESRRYFTLIPKSYVEIHMLNHQVSLNNVIEVNLPIKPHFEFKPLNSYEALIKAKLGGPDERLEDRLNIEKQEEMENEGE